MKLISVPIHCNCYNSNAVKCDSAQTRAFMFVYYAPRYTADAQMNVDEDELKGSKCDFRLTARIYASSLCVILWDFIGWII